MFGEIFNFIISLEEFLLKVNLGNFFYVKYPLYVFCDFLIYFFGLNIALVGLGFLTPRIRFSLALGRPT